MTCLCLGLLAEIAFKIADRDSEAPRHWDDERIKRTVRTAVADGQSSNNATKDTPATPAGLPIERSEKSHDEKASTANSMPAKREILTFETFNCFDRELFGSMILTWANYKETNHGDTDEKLAPHLGGQGCFVAALLHNVKKGETYRVTVRGSAFMLQSSTLIRIEEDAPLVTAGPTTSFDYARLGALTQTTPFDVTVCVQREQEAPVELTERWQAHQINDCPTAFSLMKIDRLGAKQLRHVNNPYTVAGYVNENHPWIDTILAEALRTGYCRNFTGYSGGDDMLGPQIAAIWQALQHRRITYSNIATSTTSRRHAFQHIRFLDETIVNSQANCLDGSVMLASILRKIGLNVGIVLVPGHAYVAIYDKENRSRLFAIETTMLRSSSLQEAVHAATEESEHALAKVWNVLNDDSDPSFAEINLTQCRRVGVQPIPYWRSNPLSAFRQPPSPKVSPKTTEQAQPRQDATRYAYAPIKVDSVAFDQERYYNGGGMMTSAQMTSYLNALFYRMYVDKYQDEIPPEVRDQIQRIEFCRQQTRHLEQIESVLRSNPSMFDKYREWQDTVSAINRARQAFIGRFQPPRLVMPPDEKLRPGEKEQIQRAYDWSLRTLQELDPWDGNTSKAIDIRLVPAIIERTKKICHALTLVSQLPLEY